MKPIFFILVIFILSCSDNQDNSYKYFGRMEAETIVLSSKQAAEIDSVFVSEGQLVKKGQLLAKLDSERLLLQLDILDAKVAELKANTASIAAQKKQVNVQLSLVIKNLEKTKRMVGKGAATELELDNLTSQKDVLEAKLLALNSQFSVIESKQEQQLATSAMTHISIKDAQITAPVDATVLSKYHSAYENAAPGMPLFELADLSELKATIYVPMEDIARVKIGQNSEIYVEGIEEPLDGKVSWIASESEFTPKTILTKETRSTLVYAVEIMVGNIDGFLKIGMPVDVVLKD